MSRRLVLAAALLGLAGCQMEPGKVADPVQVAGKVTLADGRPVKEVQLVLQPTQTGYMAYFKLGADGSFSGEAVPGKYAFSLQMPEGTPPARAAAALRGVPEKYRTATLDNQVEVKSGEPLQIKLGAN